MRLEDIVRTSISAGMRELDRIRTEERIESRGSAAKHNPWATDAGKPCDRQIVFSLRNEPFTDPFTDGSLMNFQFGFAAEEMMARILRASGVEVREQVPIEINHEGTAITGKIDFMAVASDSLLEVKFTNPAAFSRLEGGGRPGHRKQVNLYLHSLPSPKPRAGLIYFSSTVKGTNPLKVFEVVYDRAMALADIGRLANLAEQARSGQCPDIPEDYEWRKFPCSYCSWRKKCHG